MYTLDPKTGEALATTFAGLVNGKAVPLFEDCFKHVSEIGDNEIVEQEKAKIRKAADYYNEEVLPAVQKIQESFESFTNMAEFMNKLQMDETIATEAIDPVKDAGFDEVANLV